MSTPKIKVVNVRFKPGSHFPRAKAKAVKRALAGAYRSHGGTLTPAELWEDVKERPRHPLREFFTWSKDVAFEAWNVECARKLIRSVEIQVVYQSGGERRSQWVKDTISIQHTTKTPQQQDQVRRTFVQIERALSDDEIRHQALAQALREFKAWKSRWESFRELVAIFEAGATVESQL